MLMSNVTNKRPRTQEDFFRFCTYILEHEKYGRLLLEQVICFIIVQKNKMVVYKIFV